LASRVPETPIGGTDLYLEMVLESPAELGVENDTFKRGMLGTVPSQEPKPQRRGRPIKDMEKGEEDGLPAELSIRPAVEESVRFTHWLEPVGTTGRGGGRQKGKEKASGFPVESPAQQLERAKLAIVEIY
jgi:hypothetical protein